MLGTCFLLKVPPVEETRSQLLMDIIHAVHLFTFHSVSGAEGTRGQYAPFGTPPPAALNACLGHTPLSHEVHSGSTFPHFEYLPSL